MRTTVLLCDHAEVADGKLFINGGGWDLTTPAGSPMALAIQLHVLWAETNIKKTLHVALEDEDGQPVMQSGPAGEQPVAVNIDFEVGRPIGVQPGSDVPVPVALNFPPIALLPAHAYSWTLRIKDEEVGRVSFRTRPA